MKKINPVKRVYFNRVNIVGYVVNKINIAKLKYKIVEGKKNDTR